MPVDDDYILVSLAGIKVSGLVSAQRQVKQQINNDRKAWEPNLFVLPVLIESLATMRRIAA
ncbi:hypothetical protein AQ919_18145 [Burkholderia pseudomallei]|nr:hypothetical protein AQ919_18145 [Burkholderia pseudomallei]ONC69451.1 hypothetical protein AQ921_21265 [Burkholderia pseudomallei]